MIQRIIDDGVRSARKQAADRVRRLKRTDRLEAMMFLKFAQWQTSSLRRDLVDRIKRVKQ